MTVVKPPEPIMPRRSPPMTRRQTFAVLGGAAGVLAASPTPAASGEFDLTDPPTRTRAYVRLRGRLDGHKTFMPYRGTIFAKPEGEVAVPVFDVEGFSWTKATALQDGGYRLDSVEAGYFLDRATGKPLDRWTNPLNGVVTTAKHYRSFSHISVATGGIEPIRDTPPPAGTRFTATMGEPTVMNGKVWMHEDLIGQVPNRPKASFADPLEYIGPTITGTSLATWSADLADLADPRLAFVPAVLSYQTIGNWRPFMRMGTAPGVISWRMYGVKQPSIDGVPPPLRERVLAEYPDFLERERA